MSEEYKERGLYNTTVLLSIHLTTEYNNYFLFFGMKRLEGTGFLFRFGGGGDIAGGDVAGVDIAGGDMAGGDIAGGDILGGDMAGGDIADGIPAIGIPFRGGGSFLTGTFLTETRPVTDAAWPCLNMGALGRTEQDPFLVGGRIYDRVMLRCILVSTLTLSNNDLGAEFPIWLRELDTHPLTCSGSLLGRWPFQELSFLFGVFCILPDVLDFGAYRLEFTRLSICESLYG